MWLACWGFYIIVFAPFRVGDRTDHLKRPTRKPKHKLLQAAIEIRFELIVNSSIFADCVTENVICNV